MLSESKIRNFLCLAGVQSFTEASKKLFITQQALSKQMAQLEQELGAPLFERSSKGVVLTENGKICCDMFRRFLNEYDSFRMKLREDAGAGTLNMGFQNWFELGDELNRAAERLKKIYPAFTVDAGCYSIDGLVNLLLTGELDVVLLHERFVPEDDSLKSRALVQTPMMLVVSAKHPLATEDAVYTDFAREPFLGFALQKETPAETLVRVKSTISKYGLTPPGIKIVPNSESVIVELELGHGVGIMPGLFNRVFSNRNLKTYRTDVAMPLMCVWRKNDYRRETELYVECLCEEYSRPPAADARQD